MHMLLVPNIANVLLIINKYILQFIINRNQHRLILLQPCTATIEILRESTIDYIHLQNDFKHGIVRTERNTYRQTDG